MVKMKQQKITLATAVGAVRLERNRPMRAVHRFVSTSTINAIEHDRMCPRFGSLIPLPPGLAFLLVYGMISIWTVQRNPGKLLQFVMDY